MKKSIKIVLFSLFLIIAIYGVTSSILSHRQSIEMSIETRTTQFNKKVTDKKNIKYLPITAQSNAVSFGLTDMDGYTEDNKVFYLNKDEYFERFVNIGNFVDEDREYRVVLLINYRQQDFYVDDIPCSSYDVFVKSQEDIQIPIKIDRFKEGYNDVIFAVIRKPNTDMSDDERVKSEMLHTLYIRFTINIENELMPAYELTEFETVNDDLIPSIFMHEKEDLLKQFTHTTIKDKLDYYMTIGNIREKDMRFAVILLKDWGQTVFYDNKDVIYVDIPKRERVTFPINLNIEEKGHHELSAILIEEPFFSYETAPEAYNSIRLGVDVE